MKTDTTLTRGMKVSLKSNPEKKGVITAIDDLTYPVSVAVRWENSVLAEWKKETELKEIR